MIYYISYQILVYALAIGMIWPAFLQERGRAEQGIPGDTTYGDLISGILVLAVPGVNLYLLISLFQDTNTGQRISAFFDRPIIKAKTKKASESKQKVLICGIDGY